MKQYEVKRLSKTKPLLIICAMVAQHIVCNFGDRRRFLSRWLLEEPLEDELCLSQRVGYMRADSIPLSPSVRRSVVIFTFLNRRIRPVVAGASGFTARPSQECQPASSRRRSTNRSSTNRHTGILTRVLLRSTCTCTRSRSNEVWNLSCASAPELDVFLSQEESRYTSHPSEPFIPMIYGDTSETRLPMCENSPRGTLLGSSPLSVLALITDNNVSRLWEVAILVRLGCT